MKFTQYTTIIATLLCGAGTINLAEGADISSSDLTILKMFKNEWEMTGVTEAEADAKLKELEDATTDTGVAKADAGAKLAETKLADYKASKKAMEDQFKVLDKLLDVDPETTESKSAALAAKKDLDKKIETFDQFFIESNTKFIIISGVCVFFACSAAILYHQSMKSA